MGFEIGSDEDEDEYYEDPNRMTMFETRASMIILKPTPLWKIKLQVYLKGVTHYLIISTVVFCCVLLFGYV